MNCRSGSAAAHSGTGHGVNFTKSEEPPHLYDLGQKGPPSPLRVARQRPPPGNRTRCTKVAALKTSRFMKTTRHRPDSAKDLRNRQLSGRLRARHQPGRNSPTAPKYAHLSTEARKVYRSPPIRDIATGDGIAMASTGGRENRQHGVHPVPPHPSFPSGSQGVFDQRGARRRRYSETENARPSWVQYHPMSRAARCGGQSHRQRNQAVRR